MCRRERGFQDVYASNRGVASLHHGYSSSAATRQCDQATATSNFNNQQSSIAIQMMNKGTGKIDQLLFHFP
jgi:hypothetical protein